MVPLQVYTSIQNPRDKELLRQTRHLIIGGGAIDRTLGEELRDFPHAVWSTYGMTETLSHIALRRLNGPEATDWYTPFNDVQISLSPEGTLTIDAPQVCPLSWLPMTLLNLMTGDNSVSWDVGTIPSTQVE